jgi:hypothetical protein
MSICRYFAVIGIVCGSTLFANAQMFYDNSASQATVGPYSSSDEIADDTPFSGTQHVSSFTFKFSNTTSGPINASVRFYNVNPSTGLVGSLVATVPVDNLSVGQFQFATVNLTPSQEFDWTAMPGIYGLQNVSGGFVSIQFTGADFQKAWYEAAGASLDGFVDVTTGQFINFSGDINASFYLQISAAQTAPTLSSIVRKSATVKGGTATLARVTLTAPAPAGGAAVQLFSSKPAVASLPVGVRIPAGAMSATVQITTKPVTATTKLSIAAKYNGVLKVTTLTVTP